MLINVGKPTNNIAEAAPSTRREALPIPPIAKAG
jgi:hypothetical protein